MIGFQFNIDVIHMLAGKTEEDSYLLVDLVVVVQGWHTHKEHGIQDLAGFLNGLCGALVTSVCCVQTWPS